MYQNILKELKKLSSNVRVNELMSSNTSLKVGGPADFFILPKDIEEIINVYKFCRKEDIPTFIMGKGTNILVSDDGIRGVVIKLSDNLSRFNFNEDIIEAEAGVDMALISKAAAEEGLSGLEFSCGIPGSLGGAIIMNAGAYGGEMKDILIDTTYMNENGEIERIKAYDHNFNYRSSNLQTRNGIVLKSRLKLHKEDKFKIKSIMKELTHLRKVKQPLDKPSAGSIFKRPEGYYSGKLIEDSKLKGFKIGGAQVSDLHCGFIINESRATCNDIINLIDHIKNIVYINFGITLETEVKMIGNFVSI